MSRETAALSAWRIDGARDGWTLPPPAAWPLRLPLVRHVRAFWLGVQIERHYARWGSIGLCARSGYDAWVLFAISRGMC